MKKSYTLFALFLFGLVLIPNVAATVAGTPGSTSTIMGIPVTESFTGLTASTSYTVTCITGSNVSWSFVADSSGKGTVTVTPNAYGANTFHVHLTTGIQSSVYSFSIENMDIIPYLIPLIVIGVILGVMKSFKKMV